ncbi:hypothetical protein TVAG_315770 [Trichomonas vaginalis G3]|uniref:HECT domain-containing protein n=1 Tax=Trichomonas vaginalis (strain ATCC PRA-98 / G3) TaxID=412133 RepID=A2FLN6_TRIV3|nr:guanyl-nucleotide exchange factor protein [Trichomonas vaginalis G3]EAX94171.1 hypothetical protein TVAG_315770 [Trichomonas vaginalis G3]KAI5540671.1 guanyl-nucleotide exchange factor protein [Trichomonas vaginalis G3]|eukprot:XP_001307101.1 hypothetical protein [Trichomonas vaginalis G3]
MGISESTPDNTQEVDYMRPEYFFSVHNIENIRNDFKKVVQLAKLGQTLPDPVLLSTVIEKILAGQRSNIEDLSQKNVEKLFFEPLIADSDSHIERAKTYNKYFDHMTNLISKAIDEEETQLNTRLTELAKNFISLNKTRSTSTRILESILSTSFEVIFDNLDILTPQDIINFLDQALGMLKVDSEKSLNGISSPVIQSLLRFALKIGTYPCFQTIEIQCRIVTFLFKLGFAQSNISGCISALTYLLTLPPSGEFAIDIPDVRIELFGISKNEEFSSGEGFHFQPIEERKFTQKTFKCIIENLSYNLMRDLNTHIEGLLNGSITHSGEFFSFVADSNDEVISLSLSLVERAYSTENYTKNLRNELITLGLKIISLNIFKYCLNFSRPERMVEESDISLFNKIIEIIEKCTFSEFAHESSGIIEASISIIAFSFRFLYFPNFNRFTNYIQKILADEVLCEQFMKNVFVFLDRSPLVYMFCPKFIEFLPKYATKVAILNTYISALNLLTSELQYIENGNAKQNGELIAPLVSASMELAANLIKENNLEDGIYLLKHIIFRIVTIDTFPLIAAGFLSHVHDVVDILVQRCKMNPNSVKADCDFQRIVPQEFSVKKISQIIETPHNYPDEDFREWLLDFKGASSINFRFDSKCHTEAGNDVLKIYDSLKDGNVLHTLSGSSSQWPQSLDVPFSQVRVTFQSDQSVNFWGVKCEASALIPKLEHPPQFDASLFFLNFIFYTTGRLLLIKLQSLELESQETEYRNVIESRFIQKSKVTKISEEEKILLDKIINEENNLKFVDHMNSVVKSLHRAKQSPENSLAEKYIISSLLYQLNLLGECSAIQSKLEKDEKVDNISNELKHVWRIFNKIKLDMFQSAQKTAKLEGEPKTMRENYPEFLKQIVMKCKILLNSQSINKNDQNNQILEDLRNFITSDVEMERINHIIDRRSKRLLIRRETIDFLKDIICDSGLFGTSKISVILPLHQALSIVANISDVKGVSEDEINDLSKSFTTLFQKIVDRIVETSGSYLSLILLQILAVPTQNLISHANLEKMTIELAKFTRSVLKKQIEGIIAYRNSWRLIAVWSIKNPTEEIVKTLFQFATDPKSESCQHKALYILSLLTQMKAIPLADPSNVIKIMKDATPRVIVATFVWLEQIVVNLGEEINSFSATFEGKTMNFDGFIEFIFECIGSTMCGMSCQVIKESSSFQSHHVVVQEMIAFIRLCSRKNSTIREKIIRQLHSKFESFSHVVDFSNLDLYSIKILTSLFSILGFEVTMYSPHGYGVYTSGKGAEQQIVKINTYDSITSKMRVIPVNETDELVNETDADYVIPSARIPVNPLDFDLTNDEMKVISNFHNYAQEYLKKNKTQNYVTEFCIANFYCFLPVILQSPRNLTLFMNMFPVDSLYKMASTSTNASKIESIGRLMHKICRASSRSYALNKAGIEEVTSNLLPYSLVFDHPSCLSFVPLRFGSVNDNLLKSILKDECIFVGETPMPNTVLFYFEITIKTISNQNFQLGLMESSSTILEHSLYTFDFKACLPRAKFLGEHTPTESIKIKAGDVIGCGYTRDSVLFFHNGSPMKSAIPVTSISDFVPVLITNKCPMSLTYNFGEQPFVADVISSPLFDIKSDCLRRIDVPIPTQINYQLPQGNSLEDFDKFVENGAAIWDVPIQYSNDKPGSFHTSTNNHEISSDLYTEFTLREPQQHAANFMLGQPVMIARRSLNQQQSLSKSFKFTPPEVDMRMNKFGTITEIVHDKNDIDQLTVQILDPGLGESSSVVVDSRFVDPINCKLLYISQQHSHQRLLSPKGNPRQRFIILKEMRSLQFKLMRNLSLYMSRYTAMIIFNHVRISGNVKSLENDLVINIFKLFVLEIAKFTPNINVHKEWDSKETTNVNICEEESVRSVVSHDDPVYTCPGDLKKFNRLIRAFLMSKEVRESQFLEILIQSLLVNLNSSTLCVASDIFEVIKPCKIIESWHPMPLTSIHTKIHVPKNSVGFIPVVHPLQSIGENSIKIGNCSYLDCHSDTQLFTNDTEINYDGRESKDLYGLKIGFFVVPRRIPDRYNGTPLGAIHCLMYVLSHVFSYSSIPEKFVMFIKQKVFTQVTNAIGVGNFFVDVFSGAVLAPILTSLDWQIRDLTPQIKAAFDGFSSRYEYTIKEWAPLSYHAQQSLVMRVFTKLLVLDTMAADITDVNDKEKIANLYDAYIQAATPAKDATVFEQMTHAFAILCALGFSLQIPIKFPAYIIAQCWSESFELNSSLKISEKIHYCEFQSMKEAEIRLAEESHLPPDCVIAIEPTVGDVIFVSPGESILSTPSFTTRVVSKSGHEEYDGHDEFYFILSITCTPLTHEAKRKVFVDHYQKFLRDANMMSKNWHSRYDETLRKILKSDPSLFTKVPLKIPALVLASNPSIATISQQLLRCRVFLFYSLDQCIGDIVKVVEFGSEGSLLNNIFNSCRAAVATQFKMKTLENVVLNGRNDDMPLPFYRFNRFKAALHRARPTNPNGESILSQFIHQTTIEKIPALKRASVPWRVDLVGEGATDLGGPGRDLFTEACMEIMDPSMQLFIQTPNKRRKIATAQDYLIPNPSPLTPQSRDFFFYAGVLMTICYTSRLPEPFKFARFVWNSLTQRPVTLDDIYEIDSNFKQFILSIENSSSMSPQDFHSTYMLNFTAENSLGSIVELIPGGSLVPVTFDRRLEFLAKIKKFRVKEFNESLEQLRRGFNFFFPAPAASILAPWELELIICGDNECPIEDMKRNCSFPANDPSSTMLWDALEGFTPEERMLFIKFGTGRMGLPPPGSKWMTPLQIQFKMSEAQDAQKPLPTAMTCNSTMIIPRYSSVEMMAKKIRTAITFGADIQQDHAANFDDVVQFT